MDYRILLKNSVKILQSNRKRAFLTMLGIIIGISSVIVIMAVGAGAKSLVLDQLSSFGPNLIGILPGASEDDGPPASVLGVEITTLKQSDAEKIAELDEIQSVASYVRGVATLQYENQKVNTTFVGTTSDYSDVENATVNQGSFLDQTHDGTLSRVVVLGWQTAKDLFGEQDPLNKRIKIQRQSFRVIGVMKKRGVEGFQNQDTLVFVPLKTAQKILLGINHLNLIRARAVDGQDVIMIEEMIENILRQEHDLEEGEPSDFSVRASVQALDILDQVTGALSLFLAAIASISLLVGGIGIMNIMLVSVNERTKEIGLRKALGATGKNVENQFLAESLIMTFTGAIIGIIFGAVLAAIIALVAGYLGYAWEYYISPFSVLISVSVAGAVGIVFGWYPAKKAAELEPVEALRYE